MANSKYSSEEMARYFKDPEYRHDRQNMKAKSKKRRWRLVIFLTIAAIAFSGWYYSYIESGLPSLEQLENPKPELSTKIYSADGVVLDQFFVKKRTNIAFDKLPPGLVQSLIATEDRAFYDHWGFHLRRAFSAIVKNIIALDIDREGASTLTQQLARSLYFKPDRHLFDKITRKFRELVTAVQIERNFTKNEILELYINVVSFGRGTYGIESAAQTYFGKSASQLKPSEYSLLIGLLKGSSFYDPIRHPERALARRDVVLGQMKKEKIITPEQLMEIRSEPLNFKVPDAETRTGIAPHFVEWIRQQLTNKAETYGFDIYRDGLKVYTTLDSRMQKHANQAVLEHLEEFQPNFDRTWNWKAHPEILADNVKNRIRDVEVYRNAKTQRERDSIANVLSKSPAFIDSVKRLASNVEVGFVAIDHRTGYIAAMVGGRNFRQFKYGLNHVVQIRRQPGSAFKPFVYTVALDNGIPVSYELLNQPVTVPMADGTRWTPGNYDGDFGGKYTLRDGLKKSINLIAIRAILEIAPAKQVVAYAKRMGIKSNLRPYEAIALGTEEVSPLELTSAYGVFGNEGILVEPISILRIEDKDGNLIEQNIPEKKEVLSKETAYLMTSLLESAVNSGTGIRVRNFFHLPAAGKTGTTNDYGDAWFVGFTPQLSAGTWVGFDDNRIKFGSGEGQGGRAAAPIFGRFMNYIYNDPEIGLALEYFERPDGIITDTICTESKKKAREFCPNKTTEIFNAKYPLQLCDIHTSANWQQSTDKPSKISW